MPGDETRLTVAVDEQSLTQLEAVILTIERWISTTGLRLMNRFDKRKQFRVDLNEARYNPQRIAHFVWIGWREDGAERGLRSAFKH